MRLKKELIIITIAIVFGILASLSIKLIFAINYNEYSVVIDFLAKFFITLMMIFYLPSYLFDLSKADHYLRGTSGDILEIFILITTILWIYLVARFTYSFFSNWKERKFKIFKEYFNIVIRNKFKILFLIIILFSLILGSFLHSKSISEENRIEKGRELLPAIKEKDSLAKDKYIGFSKEKLYSKAIIGEDGLTSTIKIVGRIANHRLKHETSNEGSVEIWNLAQREKENYNTSEDYINLKEKIDEDYINFKENIYPSNQWFIDASGGWMYEFKFNKDDIVENVSVTNVKYLK